MALPYRDGLSNPKLRDQLRTNTTDGIDKLWEQLSMSPIFDSGLKFAYDIFDIIDKSSQGQLTQSSWRRPNFSPHCRDLMTTELKAHFMHQWAISEQLRLIFIVMNMPFMNNRKEFVKHLWLMYRKYRMFDFSMQRSVEFLFVVAYWSLILKSRSEYRGAPDFAIELITVFTRHVVEENGGFDVCTVWPSLETVMGPDPVAGRPFGQEDD